MAILTTQNLSKYFGAQDIFSGLNLAIHHGDRIALIGPNGQGKTTLLQILAGLETPTGGEVFKSKRVQVGYLKQHASLVATDAKLWDFCLAAFANLLQQERELRQLEIQLAETTDPTRHAELLTIYGEAQHQFEHAGGYEYEQTLDVVLIGLGFTEEDYQAPVTLLSGGQQSRAQLARLLLEKPDLLLLDEPTNHLDLASVEWLENYLAMWDGSMVVVSHDRYFLDKVATLVWEMTFGQIESYRGNFSHYALQREERQERRQKEYQAQQEFIAKEEDFIRRNIAGQRTKEAQGRRKRLERMERMTHPQDQKTLKLNLKTTLRSGDMVLATHDLVVGYPSHEPLFRCANIEIRRGDRVALLGPNGSGKTTFLKTVLRQLKPQSGAIRFGAGVEVGYFAQTHASLNLAATVMDEILSAKNLPIAEARNYLGRFLFSGDDVFKVIGTLSGGEQSRVALAKLALTGANFLILDEPTNHLDIPSQENLEDMLDDFSGTILLVSHDRYFVDAIATHTWAIEPATRSITVLEGGYSHYLAKRESQKNIPTSVTEPKSKAQSTREQTKAEERVSRQKAKQIADIEALIAATEAKLSQIAAEVEVASQAQNIARLQKLGQEYQATEIYLEELLTQWTELEPT